MNNQWLDSQCIFFLLLNLNCLGVEVATAYVPGDKMLKRSKLKMVHLGLYTLHDLSHSTQKRLNYRM